MVGAVLEAIELTQDMPDSCKNMLAAMVPEAFTVPADDRHSYQNMFVDIVGECVRKTEENMKAAISKEQDNVSALSCKRETLEKNIEDAEKIYCEKKAIMDQEKAKLAELFRIVLEDRIALSKAEQALETATAPVAELKKEVEACHGAICDLVALRDEAVESSAMEAICSKLTVLAMHLGVEETLVSSLPAACNKKPADRGAFDLMVLEQMEKEVTSKAAGFTTQIESQTANVTALEVALQAAKTKLDKTTSAHHSASSVLTRAIDEEKKTSATYSDSQVELAAFEPLFKEAGEVVEEKQASLANFQTWNVASYDVLKAKQKPIKPAAVTEESKQVLLDEGAAPQDDALPTEDAAPQQATV